MQAQCNTHSKTLKKEYNKSESRRHTLTPFLPCVMLQNLWDNRKQEGPVRA